MWWEINKQTEKSTPKQCSHPTTLQQIKTNNVYVNEVSANMSGYFRSSINKTVDKRENQTFMLKIHNEFRDVFSQELSVLKAHLSNR